MDNKELSDKVKEVMLNKASTAIDIAYESLVLNNENNKFSLQLFDQYFAPYFFQGVPIPEGARIFETWIGIAGSPLAAVDIYDNDTFMFTVPPLYDTSLLNLMSNNRATSQVIDELPLYEGKAPGTYERFINDELLPAVDKKLSDRDIVLDKWKVIASRYKVNEVKIEGINTNHDDDDISYD